MRKTHRQRKAERPFPPKRMPRRTKELRKQVERMRGYFNAVWAASLDDPMLRRKDFEKQARREARKRPDAFAGCVALAMPDGAHRTLCLWRHQKLTAEHIAQRAEFAARVSR